MLVCLEHSVSVPRSLVGALNGGGSETETECSKPIAIQNGPKQVPGGPKFSVEWKNNSAKINIR